MTKLSRAIMAISKKPKSLKRCPSCGSKDLSLKETTIEVPEQRCCENCYAFHNGCDAKVTDTWLEACKDWKPKARIGNQMEGSAKTQEDALRAVPLGRMRGNPADLSTSRCSAEPILIGAAMLREKEAKDDWLDELQKRYSKGILISTKFPHRQKFVLDKDYMDVMFSEIRKGHETAMNRLAEKLAINLPPAYETLKAVRLYFLQ